jgi:MYXO-CTERM domain-containing protein
MGRSTNRVDGPLDDEDCHDLDTWRRIAPTIVRGDDETAEAEITVAIEGGMSRAGAGAGAWVVLSLLVALAGPRVAAACPTVPREVEFVIPPLDAGPMPRDGALLADVSNPGGLENEVSLVASDGVVVPLEVTIHYYSANEHALFEAHALEPLEPNTEYVWSVGLAQQPMVTGEGFDQAIPTPGEPVAAFAGTVVRTGCFGLRTVVDEHDITVSGLREPVALVASRPGSIGVGLGSPLRVGLVSGYEGCWEVRAFDYGGHWATAGTVCAASLPADEGSSGAGDTTDAVGEGTGGGTTTDAVSTTEMGTGPAPAHDDGAVDRGCACQVSPQPHAALGLLLLLAVPRRRARTR